MGMWNVPLALFNSETYLDVYFTLDTLIGDLYTFLGSPSTPNNYNITADGCALGNVNITTMFPVGTTFQFNCINNGSIDGLGGSGGAGGGFASPTVGNNYQSEGLYGGNALSSNTFDVTVNIDDGFLRGGGGGGGGAGTDEVGLQPGGGGGGGAGFSITAGGLPGTPNVNPPALAGSNGGNIGPGIGGFGGGGSGAGADGGGGGDWGAGGTQGDSNLTPWFPFLGVMTLWHGGAAGGGAGNAFYASARNGATITFNGSKAEATLRAEGRLRGETDMFIRSNNRIITAVEVNPTSNVGITFLNDGSMTGVGDDIFLGEAAYQLQNDFLGIGGSLDHAATNGDNYLVRASARPYTDYTGGLFPSPWDNTPGADGTWFALTADKAWTYEITASGARTWVNYFEIQRDGMGADEVIDGFWLAFTNTAP